MRGDGIAWQCRQDLVLTWGKTAKLVETIQQQNHWQVKDKCHLHEEGFSEEILSLNACWAASRQRAQSRAV